MRNRHRLRTANYGAVQVKSNGECNVNTNSGCFNKVLDGARHIGGWNPLIKQHVAGSDNATTCEITKLVAEIADLSFALQRQGMLDVDQSNP